MLEVSFLIYAISTSEKHKPIQNGFVKKAGISVIAFALLEAILWVGWWHATHLVGLSLASIGLFLLMHIKHVSVLAISVEGKSVRAGLISFSDLLATLVEVLAGVSCVMLMTSGNQQLALVSVAILIGIEHTIQFVRGDLVQFSIGKYLAILLVRYPVILESLSRISIIRKLLSRAYINRLSSATKPRPKPFSMASSYTSWVSLTDRSFTGRHLPVHESASLPELNEVVDLWKRGSSEIESRNTSLLFTYFAQWFTDGFLRINFLDRTRNTSNHEIDLCQVYGLNENKAKLLRSGIGGKLSSQEIDGEQYPGYLFDVDLTSPDKWVFANDPLKHLHDRNGLLAIYRDTPFERLRRMFAVGAEHGNSTIGHSLFNTIMLREHNRVCDLLVQEKPNWSDERLFQTARNVAIVVLLRVVIMDYIKHISPVSVSLEVEPGFAEKQNWYRTNWMSVEFNLLYRWHSLVPNEFRIGGEVFALNDVRNNTPLVIKHGVENLVTSATRQRVGKIGLRNTHPFFFKPLPIYGGSGHSVMSRTIQMARDAKLRPYNAYRKAFGLNPLRSFGELTDDEELRETLTRLYDGKIDAVEWIVGIFAQRHGEGAMLGDLMTVMVGHDAFTQALTNPLLSKSVYTKETFSRIGLEQIERTNSVFDLIERNVTDSFSLQASFGFES